MFKNTKFNFCFVIIFLPIHALLGIELKFDNFLKLSKKKGLFIICFPAKLIELTSFIKELF